MVTAVVAATPAGVATADGSGTPPPVVPTSPGATSAGGFGVQAGLYGKTSLPGGHFTYSLKGGASLEDSAVVYNQSTASMTFDIYGADVTNAVGGGLAAAQQGAPMAGVGAWLTLRTPSSITVAAGQHATVKFALTVPAGTPPGSYAGALVTALRPSASAGQVSTATRVARLINLTVPGVAHLDARLSHLTATKSGGKEQFSVTVSNPGNVLFTFTGELSVGGRSVPLSPSGIYVVPGGSATITGELGGVPFLGRWSAHASVTATVPRGASTMVTTGTLRLVFFPWPLAITLAAILVAAGALLVVTRRRRRAWRARRRTERTAIKQLRREIRAGSAPAGGQQSDTEGGTSGE